MITVKNVCKKTGDKTVLNNISFQVKRGEFVAILGEFEENGKDALINIIKTIDKDYSGELFVDGRSISELDEENKEVLCRYDSTAQNYLMNNLTIEQNFNSVNFLSEEYKKKVSKMIVSMAEDANISNLMSKYPAELTKSQMERAIVLKTVIANIELILSDNPTGESNYMDALKIMQTINHFNKQYNTTVLIATDKPQISSFADTVLLLIEGSIVKEIKKRERNQEEFYRYIIHENGL